MLRNRQCRITQPCPLFSAVSSDAAFYAATSVCSGSLLLFWSHKELVGTARGWMVRAPTSPDSLPAARSRPKAPWANLLIDSLARIVGYRDAGPESISCRRYVTRSCRLM